MTDLEMTKLCREAMITACMNKETGISVYHVGYADCYDPLHDDAQALALVKKFKLFVSPVPDGVWVSEFAPETLKPHYFDADLNRAIVECVAKMQAAKSKEPA